MVPLSAEMDVVPFTQTRVSLVASVRFFSMNFKPTVPNRSRTYGSLKQTKSHLSTTSKFQQVNFSDLQNLLLCFLRLVHPVPTAHLRHRAPPSYRCNPNMTTQETSLKTKKISFVSRKKSRLESVESSRVCCHGDRQAVPYHRRHRSHSVIFLFALELVSFKLKGCVPLVRV